MHLEVWLRCTLQDFVTILYRYCHFILRINYPVTWCYWQQKSFTMAPVTLVMDNNNNNDDGKDCTSCVVCLRSRSSRVNSLLFLINFVFDRLFSFILTQVHSRQCD